MTNNGLVVAISVAAGVAVAWVVFGAIVLHDRPRRRCSHQIQLRCPTCGRASTVDRLPGDPPTLAQVIYPCRDCDDGTIDPIHRDSAGADLPLSIFDETKI